MAKTGEKTKEEGIKDAMIKVWKTEVRWAAYPISFPTILAEFC